MPRIQPGVASRHARWASSRLMKLSSLLMPGRLGSSVARSLSPRGGIQQAPNLQLPPTMTLRVWIMGNKSRQALGPGNPLGEALHRRVPSGKARVAQAPCLLLHKQDLVIIRSVEILDAFQKQ